MGGCAPIWVLAGFGWMSIAARRERKRGSSHSFSFPAALFSPLPTKDTVTRMTFSQHHSERRLSKRMSRELMESQTRYLSVFVFFLGGGSAGFLRVSAFNF
eukprot:RCo001109